MNQPTIPLGGIHEWIARYEEMHAQHTKSLAEHQDGEEPRNYAAYDEQRFTNTLEASEFLAGLVAHLRTLAEPPATAAPTTRTFDPTTTSGHAIAELFRTWCRLRGEAPEAEVDGGDLVTAVGEMFESLGLDVGGPASQVDAMAGQHVYTVFGLTIDGVNELLVAAVVPGEHAEAAVVLKTSETHHTRWAGTFVAESADAAAVLAYQQVADTAPNGWPDADLGDVTPDRHGYPKRLVNDLRDALTEWFDDHPEHPRPSAVSFGITHSYDDGPAWSTYNPTFHYDQDPDREERHDIPVDKLPDVDFDLTAVADALVEISDFEHPQDGDTLRIALRPST
ncbi:hypothetical protein GTY75_09075 [Streptomyces sp. SID8381]|uniref:hypothetical protein n=1 Tax=unclassified Streptomyces TaxID=2593676 RepID=UPI00035C8F52|nr:MULTISPECIES: hypothetical protein [unclassified Streptomyces]MYX26819.1 hypothetical protein [Streptomyces sp. SID8381]